ncbi:undecaprenyl-phosphate galactose phosphotransferase WbaP [Testudinibacter sp. TR-2022]|uniref:undecaprenyl-phosphate galactose phosphotransferase WbaP n=2 Tax=Testudinibacter sp. TR-2022 TaxID=2585029 RepID=UPI001117FC0D|nr:undecaprenyl-phosphate galactose phosphotransferase WbaP [Pasteurellaceae bacterium Phil11]TNH23446.1 undecaprenyl-phosphate galactose phosphotransferase WbaP [Testudinibacter sp. TR-2022]
MINNPKLAPKINKLVLVSCDFLGYLLVISLAYYLSPLDDFSVEQLKFNGSLTRLGAFILPAFIMVGWIWGVHRHYTYRKPFWDELKDIYSTLFIVLLINLALLVFIEETGSLNTWFYIGAMLFICFPLFRFVCKKLLRYLGTWDMACVIIGNAENAKSAYRAISSEINLGYKIKAFIEPQGKIPVTAEKLGYITEEELFSHLEDYQRVFIALEHNQSDMMESWMRKLTKMGFRNISVVPPVQGVSLYGAEVSHFFGYEAIILRLHNNLAKRSSRLIKRTFDIVAATFLLLIASPLFCYLFFKIRQDGGKATYSQTRIGRNGKAFHCHKFRTMVINSGEILRHLLATDENIREEWLRDYKLKNDPRVTPIGRFLRKTSLDELPQLWNVLKGEMSLVGPRPVIRQELKFYKDDVTYYYMVRPGLSGLWQVSGRSDTDYSTRVYLDTWYVKNWSLWNDITILAKTANVVIRGKGAY